MSEEEKLWTPQLSDLELCLEYLPAYTQHILDTLQDLSTERCFVFLNSLKEDELLGIIESIKKLFDAEENKAYSSLTRLIQQKVGVGEIVLEAFGIDLGNPATITNNRSLLFDTQDTAANSPAQLIQIIHHAAQKGFGERIAQDTDFPLSVFDTLFEKIFGEGRLFKRILQTKDKPENVATLLDTVGNWPRNTDVESQKRLNIGNGYLFKLAFQLNSSAIADVIFKAGSKYDVLSLWVKENATFLEDYLDSFGEKETKDKKTAFALVEKFATFITPEISIHAAIPSVLNFLARYSADKESDPNGDFLPRALAAIKKMEVPSSLASIEKMSPSGSTCCDRLDYFVAYDDRAVVKRIFEKSLLHANAAEQLGMAILEEKAKEAAYLFLLSAKETLGNKKTYEGSKKDFFALKFPSLREDSNPSSLVLSLCELANDKELTLGLLKQNKFEMVRQTLASFPPDSSACENMFYTLSNNASGRFLKGLFQYTADDIVHRLDTDGITDDERYAFVSLYKQTQQEGIFWVPRVGKCCEQHMKKALLQPVSTDFEMAVTQLTRRLLLTQKTDDYALDESLEKALITHEPWQKYWEYIVRSNPDEIIKRPLEKYLTLSDQPSRQP